MSLAALGDRHPDTLTSINNLGTLLHSKGEVDEAALLLDEALSMRRVTLGDRHPHTLGSMNNLARLLHDQGRREEAGMLLSEALDGCVATLAQGHRTRLRSQAWLADVLRAQGRLASARAHLNASVLSTALGPSVVTTLMHASVLSTAREALGPSVVTTLMLEAIDARLLCAEGAGLEPLKMALERMSTVLGTEHPETRRCATALALEGE